MKYEWRKLWKNSMFIKVVMLLLILNAGILFYNIMHQSINQDYLGIEPIFQEMNTEYQQINSERVKEIWNERIAEESDPKKMTARILLLKQYEYMEQYDAYLETVQEQAERMGKFSIFSDPNSFSYRNIIKTGEDFKQREGTVVEVGMDRGIHVMNSYFVGDLAVLILIFLAINLLFWQEKEKGLYPMIRCTKNGRGKLIGRKLVVLGIVTTLFCLFIYIPIVIVCEKMFGFGNINRSIQSLSDFRECVLSLTVKEYIFLWIGLKVLAMLCFAYCIACICIWASGIGQVFVITGFVGGIGYICFHSISPLSVWNFFKYMNPTAFLDTHHIIGTYQNISIFGYPIRRIELTIVFFLGLTLIGVFGTIFGFVRRNAVLHAASSSKIMEWIRKRLNYYRTTYITKQEWIRFLVQRKGILLLIGVIWIAATSIQERESFYETKIMNYRTLVREFQGPLTEELQTEIEEKVESIQNGDEPLLTQGVFMFNDQYQTVLEKQNNSGITGELIDQTNWEYVFFSPSRDYQQAAIWVAVVLFIVLSVFGSDYQKNEICLLQTTKKGRSHLSRTRMGICLFLAVTIGILLRGIIAWNTVKFHPIGDCMVPIWCIPRFDLLGDLPVWVILVLGGGLKLLGIMVTVLIMAWIVIKIKRQTIAMIIGLLLFEMPIFIEIGGISSLRLFTLANAFYPYGLLEENPMLFAAYFIILFVIGIVFFVNIWRREQYISK